jgi:hypothetical protein
VCLRNILKHPQTCVCPRQLFEHTNFRPPLRALGAFMLGAYSPTHWLIPSSTERHLQRTNVCVPPTLVDHRCAGARPRAALRRGTATKRPRRYSDDVCTLSVQPRTYPFGPPLNYISIMWTLAPLRKHFEDSDFRPLTWELRVHSLGAWLHDRWSTLSRIRQNLKRTHICVPARRFETPGKSLASPPHVSTTPNFDYRRGISAFALGAPSYTVVHRFHPLLCDIPHAPTFACPQHVLEHPPTFADPPLSATVRDICICLLCAQQLRRSPISSPGKRSAISLCRFPSSTTDHFNMAEESVHVHGEL